MTAAALTPAAVGDDLLGELRGLLDRHDKAGTIDELREIADELTGVLRRTRGRLTRLARKAEPKKTETPAEPKAEAVRETEQVPRFTLPRPQDAPPLSAFRVSPLEDAAFLQGRKEGSYRDYQNTVLCCELGSRAYGALSTPERTAPVLPGVVPVPRQVGAVRYVLGSVAVLTRRAGRRITKAVRRAYGALAMAVSAR
jgi:hypothetical protein